MHTDNRLLRTAKYSPVNELFDKRVTPYAPFPRIGPSPATRSFSNRGGTRASPSLGGFAIQSRSLRFVVKRIRLDRFVRNKDGERPRGISMGLGEHIVPNEQKSVAMASPEVMLPMSEGLFLLRKVTGAVCGFRMGNWSYLGRKGLGISTKRYPHIRFRATDVLLDDTKSEPNIERRDSIVRENLRLGVLTTTPILQSLCHRA